MALRISKRKKGPYLLGQGLELVRVDVLPDTLHVVPVLHDAVFDRVLDLQKTAKFLSLPANEYVALDCSCHNPDVLWASDTVIIRKLRRERERKSVQVSERVAGVYLVR